MRAIGRFAIAVLAAGLMLGGAPLRAQDAPPPEANEASPTQVGPRDLENFNLQGTVTRPADRPVTNTTAPPTRPPPATTAPRPAETRPAPTQTTRAEPPQTTPEQPSTRPSTEPAPQTAARSVTMQLPPIGDAPVSAPESTATIPAAPSPTDRIPLSWILAAIAVLAGAGFYAWRNRPSAAFSGGPQIDAFDAVPTPAPQPSTRPAPTPAPPEAFDPDSIGIVSTRMRPWLDIAFRPISCSIDDENFTLEFELGVFNSGNSPARAILVEASYFNAGPDQDQSIAQFFANPAGKGGRAISLAPLKRMIIQNKIVTPREQVLEYEAGGRKVFVPLLAFNALYRWSGGEGQTSASFMVGRKTGAEKLAPFRLDMVGREFRSVGKHPLPLALRN